MTYSFVSGATGGIGKAFAFNLAKRGENLLLTARSQEKLNNLKTEIEKNYNVNILTFACDLTDETERIALINFVKENGVIFSRINNVAGVDTQKAFKDYTIEKVLFQLRVNVEATVHLTHAFLPFRDKNCKIITIGSMSGVTPMPYFALYSATKSMLESFFISLHYELKKEGTFVTVVMPGGVPTREDIVAEIKSQGLWGKFSSKTPEFVAEKSIKKSNKNKLIYIPGAFNKFLYLILKIVPKRIALNFIKNRWKKHEKDAF